MSRQKFMRAAWLLLCLLLTYSSQPLAAQDRRYAFSAESNRYFADRDYDSLFRQYTSQIALQYGAPPENALIAFELEEESIRAALIPALQEDFARIEKANKPTGKNKSRKERNPLLAYRQSIRRTLQRIVAQTPGLRERLMKENPADRILRFDQQIRVLRDGTLQVVEEIRIYNGNDESSKNEIKRGITRDFPTVYHNAIGLRHQVPFSLRSVQRNGQAEAYHTEKLQNGLRTYIGSANDFLSTGVHQYRLEYQTAQQLIAHADKDELYWNVNGTGWQFSMDRVSCRITFPDSCRILEQACYTGAQGSTAAACRYSLLGPREIYFESTKKSNPGEGLTVAVSLQKGIFTPPNLGTQWLQLAKSNGIFTAGVLAVLITFLLNFILWFRLGRDPRKGVIIPQFEPPAGMSPADLGYALHQEYSTRIFSSALLDMAVHRCINIDVGKEGWLFPSPTYTFTQVNPAQNEAGDFDEKYGFDPEDLDGQKAQKGSYNAKIAAAYNALEKKLATRIEVGKKNAGFQIFSRNNHYLGLSILFWILFVIATVSWMGIYHSPWPFIVSMAVLIVLGIAVQVVFAQIMSAYTPQGRKLTDHIEGFKRYLGTTEKEVYEQMNPPEENLQLFEKYLPYAVALGIENSWTERFKQQLELAEGSGQRPGYYSFHSSGGMQGGNFSPQFASGLSATIASASTPPSSSSGGSSGGGFSGGGGGGGGGGGW